MDLCWNHCFSRSTFRAWKTKYGAAIDVETDRLKQLELENAHLRKALARASQDLVRIARHSSAVALPSARARGMAWHRPADAPSGASRVRDAD